MKLRYFPNVFAVLRYLPNHYAVMRFSATPRHALDKIKRGGGGGGGGGGHFGVLTGMWSFSAYNRAQGASYRKPQVKIRFAFDEGERNYPAQLRGVQKTRETSTNITRYLH